MLADAAGHGLVVTVEDGVRQGGAGMFIADALRASAPGSAPPIISLGIPRSFIPQGKPDRILVRLGLDGAGLARSVREALGRRAEAAVTEEGGSTQAPTCGLAAGLAAGHPTGHDTTD